MPGVSASTVAETTPRMRDCRDAVRELRASERVICGLHRLDRRLHAFWAKLPLRRLRKLAAPGPIVGVGDLGLHLRQTVGESLPDLLNPPPAHRVIAFAAELALPACFAALGVLLLRPAG